MHVPHGNQALDHIGLLRGVGLRSNSLVAVAGGAGLIGVDSGHNQDLVLDLFLNRHQAANIIQHRVLPIRRTGADNQKNSVVLSGENICNLLIPFGLRRSALLGQRNRLLHLLRSGEFPEKFHIF